MVLLKSLEKQEWVVLSFYAKDRAEATPNYLSKAIRMKSERHLTNKKMKFLIWNIMVLVHQVFLLSG